MQKTLFWCHFGLFFRQIWAKNEFFLKFFFQFLNITIVYHRSENQKRLICYSWWKCWTDGWMDRQTDKKPEFILKQQKPVYSIDLFVSMANFKFPQPEWTHPFMTTPISIFCNQLLISINLNQHANEKDFFTILF